MQAVTRALALAPGATAAAATEAPTGIARQVLEQPIAVAAAAVPVKANPISFHKLAATVVLVS